MNRKTNFTNDSFEVIKISFISTSLSYQSCLGSYLVKLLALKLTGQYWKHFLNDKNILCIPPVFYDNKFGIDFREKVEIFNTFFAEQYSLPKNNSELPKNLLFLTEKRLSNVQISNENIIKIIKLTIMIRGAFDSWNYAVVFYINSFQLCKLLSSHVLVKWNFLWNAKKPMWFRSAKKW